MFRNQLPMLSSISNEFVGYGLSSMKDEQQIHTGRPFGGIAMLWRKSLNKYISIVTYDCDRIVGLKFESNSFAALFVCVYLPYDCSDNFDDYMFLLAKISQIIDEFQTPYVYVCGDFNANTRCTSQFGDELSQLCRCNSLCLADTLFLPQDTFTFISSSHDTVSWLDHILTTTSGYSILTDACVKTDFITSDHLPLCFTISIDNLHIPVCLSDQTSQDRQSYSLTGVALLMRNYINIIHVPELNLLKLNCLWKPCSARIFLVLNTAKILIYFTIQLLTVCKVVLNSVYLKLKYTM